MRTVDEGSGTTCKKPLVSPPVNCVVWKLIYEFPERILGNCAVSVVPLPSGASHLPVTVPPTPVVNGVTTVSFGLLSLNGAPKKPHTTPALAVVAVGDAWM